MPTLIPEDGTGLTNSNSYATVAEMDIYFDNRLHSETWVTEASADDKTRALIQFTEVLDFLAPWLGQPTNLDQALRWPRANVLTRDRNAVFDNDVIPVWLKNMTGIGGRYYLLKDMSLLVEEMRVSAAGGSGGASKSFAQRNDMKALMPLEVWSGIGPYTLVGFRLEPTR